MVADALLPCCLCLQFCVWLFQSCLHYHRLCLRRFVNRCGAWSHLFWTRPFKPARPIAHWKLLGLTVIGCCCWEASLRPDHRRCSQEHAVLPFETLSPSKLGPFGFLILQCLLAVWACGLPRRRLLRFICSMFLPIPLFTMACICYICVSQPVFFFVTLITWAVAAAYKRCSTTIGHKASYSTPCAKALDRRTRRAILLRRRKTNSKQRRKDAREVRQLGKRVHAALRVCTLLLQMLQLYYVGLFVGIVLLFCHLLMLAITWVLTVVIWTSALLFYACLVYVVLTKLNWFFYLETLLQVVLRLQFRVRADWLSSITVFPKVFSHTICLSARGLRTCCLLCDPSHRSSHIASKRLSLYCFSLKLVLHKVLYDAIRCSAWWRLGG
eukprot:TRINITY_DN24038_c0_g1_i1.p1 TRINITY_DN24038_c0_g1~~TRINITY_DN24038_c0_g1_i1.p1  ORF type:complete len:395 (+),score=6.14 TRINITY_DN24038_c0_g1_i1:39-1187(+)